MKGAYEIHCPQCRDVLLRRMQRKDCTACPDCGCTQAIFLEWAEHTSTSIRSYNENADVSGIW